MKPLILLIDDRKENLDVLAHVLQPRYESHKAQSGEAALQWLLQTQRLPDVILLDIIMPGIDGYEVLRFVKNHPRFAAVPVLCMTSSDTERTALSLGADDYIPRPLKPDIVLLRVRNQLLVKQQLDTLEQLVAQKVERIALAREKMVLVLADIIEYRNIETGGHVRRVARYAGLLAEYLIRCTDYAKELRLIGPEQLARAVPLHDVGKIGVPDSILLKPGPLTAEEYEVMKTHTTIGKSIVESLLDKDGEDSDFIRLCGDIAHCHHERFDGGGYPRGLAGSDIPLAARIMAVADVYDALVSKRVYKDAVCHEEALEAMREGSGTQFDPVVLYALLESQGEFCAAAPS